MWRVVSVVCGAVIVMAGAVTRASATFVNDALQLGPTLVRQVYPDAAEILGPHM
jgi:hypothetical protein